MGVGIGFEVSRLTFDISAEDLTPGVVTVSTTLSVDGVPADDWTFEETMLEDHCVAVATKPETDREQVRIRKRREIVKTCSGYCSWNYFPYRCHE